MVLDLTDTLSAITTGVGYVSTLGLACLAVVIGVKTFSWVRTAIR